MNDMSPRPSIVSRATDASTQLWHHRIYPNRRLLVRLVVALPLLVLLFLLFRPAHQSPQMQLGRFGMQGPMPVSAAPAFKGDVPITLSELGTVTPLATVTVRTQINGQLTEVRFKEGQHVQAGDVLAVVDPRPYQDALNQAKGQLERDQALLENAVIDRSRYQTLLKQNSIAEQQVATQVALVKQYQGTVATDKAAIQTASLNLAYCYIQSPVTGRVGLRSVDPGNFVQTGDATGIAVVTQEQPMSVIFTVPEDKLPPVLARVHQNATLQVTAYDRANTTKLATGVLTNIDNQIDPTTGMVKMRAEFTNKDEMLFPNQFVNITLLVDTVHGATVVPVAAVERGAPGTYVYLVNKDNTVAVRPIKIGATTPDVVQVVSGLVPGDMVVTDGADRLKDGAKVILPGQTPPQGQGPKLGRKHGARVADENSRTGAGGVRQRGSAQ